MTSFFTFGALGSNPKAASYGAVAKAISKTNGTKHFYFFPPHDDRQPWPAHHNRGLLDNPFIESFPWVRLRWCIHDFRIFGLFKACLKHYYIGEQWRRKDEKIFCGADENGNKYWMSRRSRGSWQGRFVEPADPHWFRGQDSQIAPPNYSKWLMGNVAHTPNQIKARGEWGHNSRMGIPVPFNIRHCHWGLMQQGILFSRDPAHITGPGHILNPQYKLMEEAGFSKWGVTNKSYPLHAPFVGLHDFSDEIEEEFYRVHSPFGKANKGNDHDEWKA